MLEAEAGITPPGVLMVALAVYGVVAVVAEGVITGGTLLEELEELAAV